jgi:hypothetical protein
MRLSLDPQTERQCVYTSLTSFDDRRVRAAAVYCSDGRFGDAMDEFIHEGLGLPRYDRLAIPGGAACLAGHTSACQERRALERQIEFLIREHGLTRIILIAHDGCAFYKSLWTGWRSVEQQQLLDLSRAASHLATWNPGIEVDLYFARKDSGHVVFES